MNLGQQVKPYIGFDPLASALLRVLEKNGPTSWKLQNKFSGLKLSDQEFLHDSEVIHLHSLYSYLNEWFIIDDYFKSIRFVLRRRKQSNFNVLWVKIMHIIKISWELFRFFHNNCFIGMFLSWGWRNWGFTFEVLLIF